ncbi:MAG TPA: NAD(P)/FAD-dependent oxidoreductase [Vicinamibacterales bacterium]|nr:NAD(P)/FAD-dependent oxidoreductase [Vicinamibacterales bacterium]
MTRRFDLVVIGSGSAAATVASRCRAAGWTVAMIDKRPFGGTCALRGCDPKKVLVGAAAAIDAARALSGNGLRPNGLTVDWAELMQFKKTFTDPVPEKRKASLARAGIETFDGTARFVAPAHLTVRDQEFEATRAIVIAAGARPDDLPIEGREHLVTSEQFLELPSLPPSVAFVGGGYISFEFAHVAARAGARVTMLHRGKRPLIQFDPDLVDRLVARTRAAGIDVRLGAEVRAIESVGTLCRVTFRDDRGDAMLDADLVVHGAGRVPELDDLMLSAAGVQFSRTGVHVNDYLQSVSNPMVWAAGDCAATDGPKLTPVAGYEGRIVAANLLEGRHTTADYRAIPSVTFTVPPIARVGLSEEQARAKYPRLVIKHEETSAWYSSRRVGEKYSGFKVLIDSDSDQIVGAHLLGPQADETINLFALAMRAGITATQFRQIIWGYPTHASDTAYMV